MQGWVKLHRQLTDNPIWSDANYLKLWMFCLFEASHKERDQLVGNVMVKLERGQFVTGRKSLEEKLNKGVKPQQKLNEITWWRYLKNLEKWQMLNIKTNNKFSVVTVVNYSIYQDKKEETEQQHEQQVNNNGTTDEQQVNTNNNVNNGINENNSKKKKPSCRKYIYDDTHYSLANQFYQNILNNNPNHKKPNFEKWANDIRLMIEQDDRTIEQISYLMDWVQKDDFEMNNVLSTDKLRKRFDQLAMKVKSQAQKSTKQEQRKPKAYQSLEDWAEE